MKLVTEDVKLRAAAPKLTQSLALAVAVGYCSPWPRARRADMAYYAL
jgi:hypothetical protein